ncbi:MAG TPA: hypothetical protein VLA15_08345 [Desulfurivibrionaceae bacterium]|nr:hypothetical protein [Desulfurivibrionaceae bacterium]
MASKSSVSPPQSPRGDGTDQVLLHLRDQVAVLAELKDRLPADLAGDIRSLRAEVSRNTKDLSSLRTAVFGLSGLQSQLAELRGRTTGDQKSASSSWPSVLTSLPPRVVTWALGIAGFLGLVLIVALAFAGELGSTLAAVGSH